MFYDAQVELLIQCLPAVASVDSFVLKGVTAINLFVRSDFPISVDIDLIYLPIQNRTDSLIVIQDGLLQIQKIKLAEAFFKIPFSVASSSSLPINFVISRFQDLENSL